ncbi:toxin-antitoxin system YwqK family antitoxin [Psychroserpens jangbogonensis]|uniref:toxin-antitoxin system YwqK family antitoxin n=1 Tax=Psychroserpens jangbogonensis TaxID=1484460 RepID=UPI00053E1380|nr:toxin-antitoxin system YwqK family antitoxin [Psychroserpens jangbogonensis]
MNKPLISSFCLVFAFFQLTVSAQNDTIWYDQEWNESTKIYAEFFRPTPKKVKGKFIIKDYYISGKLQMEGPSVEQDTTVFDGEVTHYFKSGITQSTVNYLNGKPHGRATEFFEDGLLKSTSSFDNGSMNGEYKEYYSNGQLRGTVNYKNNVLDGLYQEFYDNGNKKTFVSYKDGKRSGDYKEYFQNGNIQYAAYFENDMLQGDTKMYDYDGKLKNSGSFIDNQKNGVWTSISSDNQVVTRTYEKEVLQGEMTFEMEQTKIPFIQYYKGTGMYENGKLTAWKLEKTIKDDYKPFRVMAIENGVEIWKNYDDYGNLYSEVSYDENNVENGNWKFYHSNGQLKHDITFEAKDCYKKIREQVIIEIEEIEETVIESVESAEDSDYNDANGKPGIPSSYLPNELTNQEAFDFTYKCGASTQGNYTQYYKNGKPKLKATFKNGKPIGDVQFFDDSNKKTTFNIVNDSLAFNKAIKVTAIKTESYVKLDYSTIEPAPLEMIVYYEDHYGESNIRKTIVHPLLKYYFSNLPTDSQFFLDIKTKLNEDEHMSFETKRFNSSLYYSLEIYKENVYDN